jgi:PAS domain-containing protein
MKTAQWQALIEGMLEAVLLVDPIQLHILAANRAAHDLLKLPALSLNGKPVVDLAAAPEDLFFWEDVAAGLSMRGWISAWSMPAIILNAWVPSTVRH